LGRGNSTNRLRAINNGALLDTHDEAFQRKANFRNTRRKDHQRSKGPWATRAQSRAASAERSTTQRNDAASRADTNAIASTNEARRSSGQKGRPSVTNNPHPQGKDTSSRTERSSHQKGERQWPPRARRCARSRRAETRARDGETPQAVVERTGDAHERQTEPSQTGNREPTLGSARTAEGATVSTPNLYNHHDGELLARKQQGKRLRNGQRKKPTRREAQ